MKSILLLLVFFASSVGLAAQEMAVDPIDFELDGLIFDQTRTRTGREFYENFYTRWAPPVGANGFSILLEEQPSRGRLGFLEIKVNDETVVAYHLQPGAEWMEAAVLQAVERLMNHIQNLGQLQQDLENGDQSGSGIF